MLNKFLMYRYKYKQHRRQDKQFYLCNKRNLTYRNNKIVNKGYNISLLGNQNKLQHNFEQPNTKYIQGCKLNN